MLRLGALAAGLAAFVLPVASLDPTDSIMDGDSSQSGYLPNHNMDPAVISSGSFGQIWAFNTPKSANGLVEQFYSKPLVYTPSSTGRQVVLGFSEQNRIYILDAVNGTLYGFRDLGSEGEVPFLVSDLGNCNDISGTIGITGTPVIDPSTDTVYFWAKSYIQPNYAATGYQQGAYRFHAVDAVTLKERAGFPVNINGQTADNDVTRYFTGGNVLQRTGLNLINGVVYAGFGGHCDQYNYTGWLVGMSTSGQFVTGYSTSAGPGAQPQDGTWNGGGGGAGIWMSGSAIASDNSKRLFFATGNGYKQDVNQQRPASGRVHLDTLSECMVNMKIDGSGVVTQQDYFETYEYLAMDAGDRDLGSGGVALIDPGTFSGGGVSRIAITVGKNGKAYITNADNLGGYKLGPSGTDAIIQTLTMPGGGAVFGQIGSYPLEGGYIYITPVNYPTQVYQLGFDANGIPTFTNVAQTNDSSAGRVGVGPASVTTLKGKAGTAILWIVDVDGGIRAYNAVPVNGQMQRIQLPASPSVSKFQRPAFGNGRYYLSTTNGRILGFGSPVALPLTCTSPYDFGKVTIGNYSTASIKCTANIAITSLNGFLSGKSIYQVKNSSLPTGKIAAGTSFTFPVTFNLTNYTLSGGSSSAPSVTPGVQTTSISLFTTNAVTGYSTEQPITVTGISVSAAPFVSLSPLEVDFAPIVLGSAAAQAGSSNTFVISNVGSMDMTITSVAWTDDAINPDPGEDAPVFYDVTNTTDANGVVTSQLDDDGHFNATNLPYAGTTIPAGTSQTVRVLYNSVVQGDFYTNVVFYTNGGKAYVTLVGSASTSPICQLSRVTSEGGLSPIPSCGGSECTTTIDFGTTYGNQNLQITIQMDNNGGSGLTVTKSKPPEGTVLGAQNPSGDLHEGLKIAPGDSESATVFFNPPSLGLNSKPITYSGAWTLNTDDLTWGVHTVNFTGTLIAKQTGPQNADGSSRFQYLGCFRDQVNNIRLEPHGSANANMTNGLCQNTTLQGNYIFSGTEYSTQCWSGNVIPSSSYKVSDTQCSANCGGSSAEACGGQGGYASIYYDSTRYFPQNGTIIGASGAPPSPLQNLTIGNTTYGYAGCWTDGNTRYLNGAAVNNASGTIESCGAYCAGYSIFGAEYATECYCGTSLNNNSILRPDSECSMSCGGNDSEFCGAGSRMSLYTVNGTAPNATVPTSPSTAPKPPANGGGGNAPATGSIVPSAGGFTYVDCHSDATNNRALRGKTLTDAKKMTIEFCASTCSGFSLFGVEYGQECYCGNALVGGSATVTDGRCNMNCAGNATEVCGGSNGIVLYSLAPSSTSTVATSTSSSTTSSIPAAVTTTTSLSSTQTSVATTSLSSSTSPSSSVSSSTTSASSTTLSSSAVTTTSTSVSSSVSSSASATPTAGSVTNLGCYTDNNVNARTLSGVGVQGYANMSVEYCQSFCSGYAYFGVEYGQECYCGNSIASTSGPATDGRCSTSCSGNANETCGGSYGLNLYQVVLPKPTSTSTAPSSTPTGPTQPKTIGAFNFVECRSDNTTIRTLQGFGLATNDMTLEYCIGNCTARSFAYAGVEYAKECYCSNKLSFGSFTTTDGRCNMPCVGNSTELCGGSNGLSLYSNIVSSSSLSSSVATTSTSSSVSTSSQVVTSTSVLSSSTATSVSTSLSSSSSSTTSTSTTSSSSSSSSVSSSTSLSTSTSLPSTSSTTTTSSQSSLSSSSTSSSSTSSVLTTTSQLSTSSSSVMTTTPSTSSTSSQTSPSTTNSASSSTSSLSSSTLTSSSLSTSTVSSSLSTSSSSTSPATSSAVSSSTQTSSSSVSSSATSSSATGSATALPWAYVGCANDTVNLRALSGATKNNASAMTVEMCQAYCQSQKYGLAGLEAGAECYCGTSLAFNSTVGYTGCSTACPGNASESCGGSRRLSVYNYTLAMAPQIVKNVGTYNYSRCYTDNVNQRTLPTFFNTNTTGQSVEQCVGLCAGRGLQIAGLEYGNECFCANKINPNATIVSDSYCTAKLCAGNSRELCGAANYMLVYSNITLS